MFAADPTADSGRSFDPRITTIVDCSDHSIANRTVSFDHNTTAGYSSHNIVGYFDRNITNHSIVSRHNTDSGRITNHNITDSSPGCYYYYYFSHHTMVAISFNLIGALEWSMVLL